LSSKFVRQVVVDTPDLVEIDKILEPLDQVLSEIQTAIQRYDASDADSTSSAIFLKSDFAAAIRALCVATRQARAKLRTLQAYRDRINHEEAGTHRRGS
jgi:hypothetical protein